MTTIVHRMTCIAFAVAAATMPLLRPTCAGNSGLADVGLVAAIVMGVVFAVTGHHPIRLPYVWPVTMMVLAGTLAMVVTGTTGGVITMFQDVFVFAWSCAIATIARDRRILDVLCRAWAYSTVASACLMIAGVVFGVAGISGVTDANGMRASFTLGDPNLAANYFLVGLLVIRATRRPGPVVLRWLACLVTSIALLLTMSNGGVLALLVATVLGALFTMAARRGLTVAIGAGAGLILACWACAALVDLNALLVKSVQSSQLVRDSIGREQDSSASRSVLFAETVTLWLQNDTAVGIGPANTESTMRAALAPYPKESHNDYLAALVERGLLGSVGLMALGGVLMVRARRIATHGETNHGPLIGVPRGLPRVVPRPELLGAAMVGVALSGLFYETLHFRHVWALFGLVAALSVPENPCQETETWPR